MTGHVKARLPKQSRPAQATEADKVTGVGIQYINESIPSALQRYPFAVQFPDSTGNS